jgi:hypothetical protein
VKYILLVIVATGTGTVPVVMQEPVYTTLEQCQAEAQGYYWARWAEPDNNVVGVACLEVPE